MILLFLERRSNQMKQEKLKQYSQKQLNHITESYAQGLSIQEICKRYSITANQFTNIRRTLKLLRPISTVHPFVEQAVQDHINGMLLKDVCAKYNISSATIYKYMKKHNICYENGHGRRYHCNESFFHVIDTEAKAYWLGFIYGDGCVAYSDKSCTAPNRLTINLSSQDRCQLENFNRDIQSNFPIVDYIPKGSYAENPMNRLYVNSIEMCKDLISHGCVPNKTRQLSFPYDSMSTKLYRHFIRGLFDADGYIGIGPTFCITKYIPFLEQIQEILMYQVPINGGRISMYKDRAEGIGDLRYHSVNKVTALASYLYRDTTVFLKRKYHKAYSVLAEYWTIPSSQ